MGHDSNVECILRVAYIDFCALRGRLAIVGLHLPEPGRRTGSRPCLTTRNQSVDLRRLIQANRLQSGSQPVLSDSTFEDKHHRQRYYAAKCAGTRSGCAKEHHGLA